MDIQTDMPSPVAPRVVRNWGFWALIAGALAMALVFYQIVGPSFEPKPSAGTQIGEIAGEMKRAAWRSFFGLPSPEPEPQPVPITDYLMIAAPVLGIIAVVLSVISGVLGENRRFPVYAASLGVGAILFQYLWILALMIVGVVLLVAIIANLGEFFSF